MSAPQYLPIPPGILALAVETVTRKVSRLPFQRSSVMVTPDLIGVTLEYLNAEPNRTLPLLTIRDSTAGAPPGLDRLIEGRLQVSGAVVAPVIAEVLTSAGICEPAPVHDRVMRQSRRGLRLLPPWTWHIASTPSPEEKRAAAGLAGSPDLAWLNLCPVCRAGRMAKVTGKQLFGIPHTDFFIECNACGARLIPVGPAYRCVSIATVRDPLWRRHLDTTHTADEWAALARGTSPGGNPLLRQKGAHSPDKNEPAGKTLSVTKDGSLAVPAGERTLYFRPVALRFSGSNKGEVWARHATPLNDLLGDPAYAHLKDRVLSRYQNYLPLATGLFLHQLKERHDPFYREFLNPYGDEKYCTFRADESPGTDKAGILVVVVNRSIYHAISCPVSFRETINTVIGRITPDLCLLNGDALRCRINAVLCTNRNEAGLFIYPAMGSDEREQILMPLIASCGTGAQKTE